MNAQDYNLAPPEIRSALRNAAVGYTGYAHPHIAGLGVAITRLRPSDLASKQRSYQMANFGFWDPAAIYLITSPTGDPPDPTYPRNPYGTLGLIDQAILADPADQYIPRAAVNAPRSTWTGCSRRRRNR
jgi:hypothetical protein